MAFSKTAEQNLFTMAVVSTGTAPSNVSPIDVSAFTGLAVGVRMGRTSTSAFTAPPVGRLQGTAKSSPGAQDWRDLARYIPALGQNIGSQTVNTGTSGTNSLVLAGNTNFAPGDFVLVQNSTLSNSEWVRFIAQSTNTFTLIDNLANTQTTVGTARNKAEEWTQDINVESIQKVRFVVDAYNAGQSSIWQVVFGASGL